MGVQAAPVENSCVDCCICCGSLFLLRSPPCVFMAHRLLFSLNFPQQESQLLGRVYCSLVGEGSSYPSFQRVTDTGPGLGSRHPPPSPPRGCSHRCSPFPPGTAGSLGLSSPFLNHFATVISGLAVSLIFISHHQNPHPPASQLLPSLHIQVTHVAA